MNFSSYYYYFFISPFPININEYLASYSKREFLLCVNSNANLLILSHFIKYIYFARMYTQLKTNLVITARSWIVTNSKAKSNRKLQTRKRDTLTCKQTKDKNINTNE